jgi:hypothetical protein
MSLLPARQTQQVNIDYPCPFTQERGGILTYVMFSGIQYVQYAPNPSGAKIAGIQMNDIENVNFVRQPFQQYIRVMDLPFTIVGASRMGDYITDWIYPIGPIMNGDLAYLGPSGMITNSPSFGGDPVGTFLGPLQDDPHTVTMRGLGFSYEYIDPITKAHVIENDPKDAIFLATPGYIKVRIRWVKDGL